MKYSGEDGNGKGAKRVEESSEHGREGKKIKREKEKGCKSSVTPNCNNNSALSNGK